MILITLIFIVYTCLDAITQAFYYDSNPDTKDIHGLFLAQRAIVVASLSFNLPSDYSYTHIGIFALALCLIYSFFHNGVYYFSRHTLNKNIYPKGFFSNSETSTAVMEFGIGFRTALAVIGFVFLYGLTL